MRRKRSLHHRLLFALGLAICARTPVSAAADVDWPTHGGTYLEQRFSPLHEIDTGSVKRLSLAWHAHFDTDRGQEATPLVVDGMLYITTAWTKVFASTPRPARRCGPSIPRCRARRAFKACCDVVNRGVAVWKGKVYVGTIDGRLIALDAQTGKLVWSQLTDRTRKPTPSPARPAWCEGKVIIGNGGAEYRRARLPLGLRRRHRRKLIGASTRRRQSPCQTRRRSIGCHR